MHARNWIDLIGGFILVGFGLWYMNYSLAEYNFGNARRMGPGYFPAVLGGLLAGLGAIQLLAGFFQPGGLPEVSWRPMVTITLGITAFALLIERFGLVPATVALVVVSALAETPFRPVRTAIIAACLALMAVSVFSWGLGIPIPAFRWEV